MPVFMASGCGASNCHGGMSPKAGLDLRSATVAFMELDGGSSIQCTNQLLVQPGQPEASYLINKLTGNGMCSGGIMPKGAPAMSSMQIDVVRAWIANGALDN